MPSTPEVLRLLGAFESPNVTFVEPDGSWPIVWARAKGVHVWDADGRRYLDLTAAFGVANAGHANPRVVRAAQHQLARLPHAMGDVHPHPLKAALARELSRLTFERWSVQPSVHGPESRIEGRGSPVRLPAPADPSPPAVPAAPPAAFRTPHSQLTGKTIFGNSGFEAVEAALKTTLLATGKPRVIAFAGAYHGLGYGALSATHRDHFRSPFRRQLAEFADFVPFPGSPEQLAAVERQLHRLLARGNFGAVLVEPIQGRGGINVPPQALLPLLRRLCDDHQALLVVDEVYTGFGRTGRWFACEHTGTVPDLICLGKALTGGFPLSACVGRANLMDAAWPRSTGEAIHTSTFLGNPVGCAMALAQIAEIERRSLIEHSARLGQRLLDDLASFRLPHSALRLSARGQGLMAGLEVREPDGSPATQTVLDTVKRMLHRGFILLPEGAHANVISFTPPLTITGMELRRAVLALEEVLRDASPPRPGILQSSHRMTSQRRKA